jgi:hypothetical protein
MHPRWATARKGASSFTADSNTAPQAAELHHVIKLFEEAKGSCRSTTE